MYLELRKGKDLPSAVFYPGGHLLPCTWLSTIHSTLAHLGTTLVQGWTQVPESQHVSVNSSLSAMSGSLCSSEGQGIRKAIRIAKT